jgi:Recombinase
MTTVMPCASFSEDRELHQEGVMLRGARLRSSVVHQILRKRLYMGDFDWNGVTYQGNHEPLVTAACWQRVQDLLDNRAQNKTRKVKHGFEPRTSQDSEVS